LPQGHEKSFIAVAVVHITDGHRPSDIFYCGLLNCFSYRIYLYIILWMYNSMYIVHHIYAYAYTHDIYVCKDLKNFTLRVVSVMFLLLFFLSRTFPADIAEKKNANLTWTATHGTEVVSSFFFVSSRLSLVIPTPIILLADARFYSPEYYLVIVMYSIIAEPPHTWTP